MRVVEVRELDGVRLLKELADQERALLNLRFRKATLQLPDSNAVHKTKLTISRIKTVIRERQIVAAMKSGGESAEGTQKTNG
jgi:ribosomal protein L29